MKKSLLIIAAVCASAACLGACNSSCGGNEGGVSYDDINAKLNGSYSQIDITVTDTFDADTSLVSEYSLKYSDGGIKVSYTVERFADIPDNLDVSTVPDTVKTYTGEIEYKDGKVVAGDIGIAATIPQTGISFKAEYFDNANITENSFNADVKDAGGFMGSAITCTDMKVSANYLESFTSMKITYKSSNGNTVECNYEYKV